jgi:hypothetical protein
MLLPHGTVLFGDDFEVIGVQICKVSVKVTERSKNRKSRFRLKHDAYMPFKANRECSFLIFLSTHIAFLLS